MGYTKIIFLCSSNASLSLMAEEFAKQIAPESVEIFSAGIHPDRAVHPMTIEIMKEFDLTIQTSAPKTISDIDQDAYHIGISLDSPTREATAYLPGCPVLLHWDLSDPISVKGDSVSLRESFKRSADQIYQLVQGFFHKGCFSALMARQHLLDGVLNSFSEAILAHDLNRKIFYVNEGAAKFTGMTPGEIVGRDCHEVFSPRLCSKNCSFCDGTDSGVSSPKSYTTVFHNPEGVRKECEVTVIPLRDQEGTLKGVMASLRNITKLKSLERQLNIQDSFNGIIGVDHQMRQLFQQVQDIALYDYPVHITGETGSGKELVAKAIHMESSRRDNPFVPINCGALPEGLVESELFGHVKGAFSGAIRDKKGRFELADKGTILLDEIADLPKQAQVKLLRVLQEGKVEKIGSEKSIKVNIRIISATNRDLKQEVKKETFREDLYYRLNVIPLCLPPLRKRKTDIPLLCRHFLKQAQRSENTIPTAISDDAMSMLMDYNWPGNVRELENTIRFAIVRSKSETVQPEDLPMELQESYSPITPRSSTKKLDLNAVRKALVETGGNKAKAARLLKVGRATLYRFLNDNPLE